jgi:hydrogenase expression/formation protein HypD
MKYIDEYRDRDTALKYVELIRRTATKPWTIMEICGGQTHAIVRYGIEELIPSTIRLVHGPGCPVCVTPLEIIDKAIAIASMPDVIFTSYGDMLRVPGSKKDLLTVKAEGGDVRIVYSPMDAVAIAREHPNKRIVFFAVGFETTAPANAMSVVSAAQTGTENYSILCSHVLVPPAMKAILSSPSSTLQGFLAAGHVCTVMGYKEYEPIAKTFHIPIVVTGFEPVDILQGLAMTIKQLEEGSSEVQNQYSRSVSRDGNLYAQKTLSNVFDVVDRNWRGIGMIPLSGWRLKSEFARYDAEHLFDLGSIVVHESPLCIAGNILQGLARPNDCAAFGNKCTPEHPLGAPMVSSEGACSAYYRYRLHDQS